MEGLDSGYSITPECLSARECDEVVAALSASTLARSRAGIRHLMANPVVATLTSDERLIALATQWLGQTAVPFRATLFEKSSATNWLIPWHQDTALPIVERAESSGWGPWSRKLGATYAHAPTWALERIIALRVHLDDSSQDNGPLRVVPGSHLEGILTDRGVAEYLADHERVECLSPRGGVVAMRPLLIHASSKAANARPRRVLHIEYADSLDLGEGIRLAVV